MSIQVALTVAIVSGGVGYAVRAVQDRSDAVSKIKLMYRRYKFRMGIQEKEALRKRPAS